jgi:flagellar hook-associated protein 3 FlgL
MAITPRITQRLMVERSLSSMQAGLGRLSESQEQLSTGRIINRPSDSPTGTNTAMHLREALAGNTQFARNAEDGLGWLGRIDGTMTSMLDQVRKARELIVQGASTGTGSSTSREALATELSQIREGLLDLANTKHLGRPVFGGTTAGGSAYASDGSYVGDTGAVNRSIGHDVRVQVNITGQDAFGVGTDNLFAVIDEAITSMRSAPDSLGTSLDRLDTIRAGMETTLATVGTRYGRIENTLNLIKDAEVDLTASLSEVENVDIAKAIVELQMQEVAYQAALGATARVLQPSLIDFLR